jgi:hypothetical protein
MSSPPLYSNVPKSNKKINSKATIINERGSFNNGRDFSATLTNERKRKIHPSPMAVPLAPQSKRPWYTIDVIRSIEKIKGSFLYNHGHCLSNEFL